MGEVAGKRLIDYMRLGGPVLAAALALGLAVGGALLSGGRTGGVVGGVESLSSSSANLLVGFTTLVPVCFAFGAGMVSSVNPCGFAMLPAYLGLYLGSEEDTLRRTDRPLRGAPGWPEACRRPAEASAAG